MTVVVGTAGHIDHGKTALLRVLTGIDADRLPEERARGMTIDVGYAHLVLDDGTVVDFVDVPGHDRLVGNMLVGAGEIDAAMLVVAADDGPRAQTREHLDLLDALGIRRGVAVVTKADLVEPARAAEVVDEVRRLLGATSLTGADVLAASASTGDGLPAVRAALAALVRAVTGDEDTSREPARLAIDRAFAAVGRGAVVTGTLRGTEIERGAELRLVPDGRTARIRDVQVHGAQVDRAEPGRVALNLAGVDAADLRRGQVLAAGPDVVATDRLLVVLARPAPPPALEKDAAPPSRAVLHLGTDRVEATVVRRGRLAGPIDERSETAVIHLARPVAAAVGDRLVLRPPAPRRAVGGVVLDPVPPRGVSLRRANVQRRTAVATAVTSPRLDDGAPVLAAAIDLHGSLPVARVEEIAARSGRPDDLFIAGPLVLAPDVVTTLAVHAVDLVEAHRAAQPLTTGMPVADLRAALTRTLRRAAACDRSAAETSARAFADALIAAGRLERHGDRVMPAGTRPDEAGERRAAMDRLVAALDTPAPGSLADAARTAGCPPDAIRELAVRGEIVRIEDDLAFSGAAWDRIEATAIGLAREGPLPPAVLRDALGSSRRYVMAILEELNRQGLLVRTPAGHVLGQRAREGAWNEAGAR